MSALPLDGSPSWVRRYVLLLVVLDFVLAAGAASAARFVRFGDAGGRPIYRLITLAFPLGWIAFAAAARAYESRFLGSGSEEYRRVFDAAVRYSALVATLSFAMKAELARGYVVVAFPLAAVLTLGGRYAARQLLQRARRDGACQHKVVVVGRERAIAELVRRLRQEQYAGFCVVGVCVDTCSGPTVEDVPVVGDSQSIVAALAATGADTVAVAAWSTLSQADLRRLCWELEGTGVSVVVAPSLTDIAGPRIHIRPVAGLPLLHVEQPEFTGTRRLLKGALDRVAALLALVVLSPVLLCIAVLVRATSRGPALFRQTRAGIAGSTFTMLKFRSMRVTAEEELAALVDDNERSDGLLFKIRKDPRITPLGSWLRRFSLDELPQLFNVLRGEMSLVGPRPPLPSEVAQYEIDVRRRLLVKPGLTGLWQISGRSDLTWEESVRLDLHYVENWSLALDLLILWKTAFAVCARRGAY